MKNRNIKWHQLTGEEALRQLGSNASCGLSRKEARSRLRRGGDNDLFEFRRSSFAPLRMLLTDPSLLLFAAVCLLTVCFAEFALGIPALVLFCVYYILLLCIVLRMRYRRDRLRKCQIPRACVLRDGRPVRISARMLVPGDVVLLCQGDVVPADCRLLDAERLRTRLVLPPASSGERPTMLLQEKHAQTVYPYGAKLHAPDYENLVYGGAEVLAGSARAVVTETGAHSFLGAMGRQVLREPLSGHSGLLSGVYPYLRLFGFALLVLLLPLSVVGLLISPEHLSTLRIFLPLCALVASGTAAVAYILFRYMLSFPGKSGAVVITDRGTDRLPDLTDLVVLGHCGTSDGLSHFYRATNGERMFLPDAEQQSGLQPLCEAFVLLSRARAMQPQRGLSALDSCALLPDELVALSGYDLRALDVRLVRAELHSAQEGQFLDVQMKGSAFHLRFTTGIGAVTGCVSYENASGGCSSLEPDMRENLRRFAQQAAAQGCPVLTVTKEQGRQAVLVGCITCRERLLPGIAETVHRFETYGVQVRFFFSSQNRGELFYAAQCGAQEGQVCLASEHPDPAECAGYRWYIGYGRREAAQFVKALRRQGRTVAVLAEAVEDECVLAAASLRIACDSDTVRKLERNRSGSTDGKRPSESAPASTEQMRTAWRQEAGGVHRDVNLPAGMPRTAAICKTTGDSACGKADLSGNAKPNEADSVGNGGRNQPDVAGNTGYTGYTGYNGLGTADTVGNAGHGEVNPEGSWKEEPDSAYVTETADGGKGFSEEERREFPFADDRMQPLGDEGEDEGNIHPRSAFSASGAVSGCPQMLLRDADLLISDSDGGRGGIPALLLLLRRARETLARVQYLMNILTSFHMFRTALLVLCILTGAGPVTAYAFLYVSVFVDLAVFDLIMRSGVSRERTVRPVSLRSESVRKSFRNRRIWLIPLISASALVLLLTMFRMIGLISDENSYPVLFCAMLLMQIMLFVFNREPDGILLPPLRRSLSRLLPLLLPVPVAVVLSALVPAVDAVTELGSWSVTSVVLLAISPFLVLLSILLFSRFSAQER